MCLTKFFNYSTSQQYLYCLLFLGTESLSGQSTSWNSSHSQLSINIQSPVINNALKFLNQSPVANKKLNNKKYLEKKITDVSTYLLTTSGLEKKSEDTILPQEFLDTFETLKKKFHDKETTKREKIQILISLPSNWSTYKLYSIMEATKDIVKVSKSLTERRGVSLPDSKSG